MSDATYILAIESSCDETAAAVLSGPRTLCSSAVHSQIEIHRQYGGVVPELASRSHVMAIDTVVNDALREAGISRNDLRGIAVTMGPGLVGSLLVGLEYARGLGWALDVPVHPVHHIEGHLRAPFLAVSEGFDEPEWPFVGLVVSGGHSSLYHCAAPGVYEELGRTLDDAAGEAFDKVSKHLGLGYPGGAVIDRLARGGNSEAIAFPRPMAKKGGYHFSFSGIKTAVSLHLESVGEPDDEALCDLAASFQEAVVDVLVEKTVRAARDVGVKTVVVTGGVACNSRLRSAMAAACSAEGLRLSVPPPRLCTDNAAMIGAAGYDALLRRIESGERFDAWDLNARATWRLAKASSRAAQVKTPKVRS